MSCVYALNEYAIFSPHKNQQLCSGDILLHPARRNSSHKHPQVKRCWHAYGLNLVTKSMATVTATHFSSSVQGWSTNIWVNSSSFCCRTVPVLVWLTSSEPTPCHAIGGAHANCIQPGLSSIWFWCSMMMCRRVWYTWLGGSAKNSLWLGSTKLCISGPLSKFLRWFFLSQYLHPWGSWKGFSCTCLIFAASLP